MDLVFDISGVLLNLAMVSLSATYVLMIHLNFNLYVTFSTDVYLKRLMLLSGDAMGATSAPNEFGIT